MNGEDYTDFVHTGAGTLGGRYMRMFWQPVYRGQDLAPGRAVPIRIMGEDFTLYRGEGGTPHMVAFRCAHRGTQLSTGWVEGDCLRCRYHGWKYDGSGQCVEQPGEDSTVQGLKGLKIRSYPTEEYHGLIFAYLGEGEPPPFQRFLAFEGIVEAVATQIWPCNYSNRLDNDANHIPFVHKESRRRVKVETPVPLKTVPEETEFGIRKNEIFPGGRVKVNYKIWPNGAQHTSPLKTKIPLDDSPNAGGWMDRRLWRVPVDDENCISFGVNLVHLKGDLAKRYLESRDRVNRTDKGPSVFELGSAVIAGKMSIEDIEVVDIYRLILVEDFISQVGQGRVPDYKSEIMANGDSGTFLRRKIWERELKAFAEGRPLKQWIEPPRLTSIPEKPDGQEASWGD